MLVEMGALSAFYLFQFDIPHHISRTKQHRITDAHAGVDSFPATATRQNSLMTSLISMTPLITDTATASCQTAENS